MRKLRYAFRLIHPGQVGTWQNYLLVVVRCFGFGTIRAILLIQLRAEMSLVLRLLSQTMKIELGQGYFGPHQNDQLRSIIYFFGASEEATNHRNPIEYRNSSPLVPFIFGDQSA